MELKTNIREEIKGLLRSNLHYKGDSYHDTWTSYDADFLNTMSDKIMEVLDDNA